METAWGRAFTSYLKPPHPHLFLGSPLVPSRASLRIHLSEFVGRLMQVKTNAVHLVQADQIVAHALMRAAFTLV
jgi:hypothetical protein